MSDLFQPSAIGAALKEARLAVGEPPRVFADRVGMTPTYIAGIESGRITPTEGQVIRLARALRQSLDQWLELAGYVSRG